MKYLKPTKKSIFEIIKLVFHSNKSVEEIINLLGVETKRIGRHHFIIPNSSDFINISITVDSNKISSCGADLKNPLELHELEEALGQKSQKSYSIYDELSSFNFFFG